MDIAFVILHYKAYEDTVDCIESIIEHIDTAEYGIIVVDNASANGSFEKLNEKYRKNQKVVLIGNEKNLGFANGLNVGIEYARENLNPDFIAAINNDTMLLENDLCAVLKEKYERYEFAVFGPMIITRDGRCDINPIRNTIRSAAEVRSSIARYKRIIKICDFHCLKIYNMLKPKPAEHGKVKTSHLHDQIDYKLHGSFWIFSRKYFEKFEGLDNSTFLYGEEDILYLHVIANKMKTLYSPDVKIYHKEDASTNAMFSSEAKKTKFVYKNAIESLRVYLRLYEKYEGKTAGSKKDL